jgi:seryl-tRNA synthetase
MATLYEIDRAIEQVIETGFSWDEETGEVLFEEGDLEQLQVAFNEKLEACGIWMKNQKSLADAIRAEEKALYDRRKAIEKRLERMNGYVLRCLMKTPKQKLETPMVALSTRKSTRTIVDDEAAVPDEFTEQVVTVKVNKTEIGKALKAGREVAGAHLEVSQNLQVK